jgi:uncharacterized protein
MVKRTISIPIARRLAISRQLLAGARPPATAGGLMRVARRIRCIQVDPTKAVAPTQFLVPFSRLGSYDPALLDRLLWDEKKLFYYWAHAASLVLTEDYPLHRLLMDTYLTGDAKWVQGFKDWLATNDTLRRSILRELEQKGPLRSRDFTQEAAADWKSSGWTAGRNVTKVLDYLWTKGEVMVAGRSGAERVWDLAENWWPSWMPREQLPADQIVRMAASISLRCLGVATAKQINDHFTRWRYGGLTDALTSLESDGEIVPIKVEGLDRASWFIHRKDLTAIRKLESDAWEPRTVLLSPFDNLICDRARTESLFDFHYRIEIYVPKTKRRFGYFSMPVLHGDRLIGRVDPAFDRKTERLVINSAHAEPSTERSRTTAVAVRGAIEELASWLGARTIEYRAVNFDPWKRVMR